MAKRNTPDAPADAERVSLHGPPFEDVLRGLLTVDPKNPPTDVEELMRREFEKNADAWDNAMTVDEALAILDERLATGD